MWLNDLLARLSPIELRQARELDAKTFNMYSSQCFIPVLTRDFAVKQMKKNDIKSSLLGKLIVFLQYFVEFFYFDKNILTILNSSEMLSLRN